MDECLSSINDSKSQINFSSIEELVRVRERAGQTHARVLPLSDWLVDSCVYEQERRLKRGQVVNKRSVGGGCFTV